MKFRDLHRNVKIRIIVLFAFGTVQSSTTPFMAIYFARQFGQGLTGILLTVSILSGILSGLIGGYYADRMGRRQLMILSEAVFLVAYVGMAVFNSPWVHSALWTFVAFLVTNVCWGIYGPVDEAMMLDVTDAKSRPYVYGMVYWIFNLTMAIGASIGALAFESYRFELFGVMALVLLGTLFTTVLFIQETHPSPGTAQLLRSPVHLIFDIVRSYTDVLNDVTFIKYVVASILIMAVEFQLQNYIGIRLAQQMPTHTYEILHRWSLHLDGVHMLGFLQTENTVLVVAMAALASSISQRLPDRWVLAIGIGINVLGYSVMVVTNSPLLLFLCMFVATLGEVLTVPVRQTYLGDIAREDARSSYMAVNGMAFSGSRVLASLGVALGAVMPSWGVGVVSILVGVAGLGIYLAIVPVVHARRVRAASTSITLT